MKTPMKIFCVRRSFSEVHVSQNKGKLLLVVQRLTIFIASAFSMFLCLVMLMSAILL